MNSKTVLGISFTAVFVLSIISAITAIQADAVLKVKHLPDLRTTKSASIETVKTNLPSSDLDLTSSWDERLNSGSSILEKGLKN